MDFEFTEEQKMFRDKVRRFAREKLAPITSDDQLSEETPWEVARLIGAEGLCKVFAPEKYGGVGVSSMLICIGREEFNRICLEGDHIFTAQGLGSYPITLSGSDEQKRKYIPPVLSCEKLCAFCLTEPNAGSDAAGLQATARLDGDYWILNGEKIYVSEPGEAEVFTVFAKTDPTQRTRGISAFIVEKGYPGVSFAKQHLNVGGNVGHLIMQDCKVPKENLFGEVNSGMKIALGNLDVFRTSVGSAALGMAERALDDALRHAKQRVQFGQPIADFQAIQFKLANMATEIDAARLLVYRAAWLRDDFARGKEESELLEAPLIKEASMAKLFATEVGQRVVDEAVQIHGGVGIARGTRVERLYRAVRAPRIYEGTSEIQRRTIARQLLKG